MEDDEIEKHLTFWIHKNWIMLHEPFKTPTAMLI